MMTSNPEMLTICDWMLLGISLRGILAAVSKPSYQRLGVPRGFTRCSGNIGRSVMLYSL